MSLKKGAILSYAGTYISIGLGLISSIILARTLSPEEIGIASIAFAIVAISNHFRDLGIQNFVQTNRQFDSSIYSNCISIGLATGTAICICTFAGTFLARKLNFDERVLKCINILMLNSLLIPPQAVIFSALIRDGAQGKILFATIISALANLILSWKLSQNGYAYSSGPFASVLSSLAGLIFLVCVRDRRLHFHPTLKNAKLILSVSLHSFILGITKTITDRAPELSIAAFLNNYQAVAYLEKAATATELGRRLVFDSLTQLFFPVLRKALADSESTKLLGSSYLSLAFIFGFPVSLWLFFCGEHLVVVLFGQKWIDVSKIINTLSFCVPSAFYISALSQIAFLRGDHSILTRNVIPLRIGEIILIAITAWHSFELIPLTIVVAELFIAVYISFVFRTNLHVTLVIKNFLKGTLLAVILSRIFMHISILISESFTSPILRLLVLSAFIGCIYLVVLGIFFYDSLRICLAGSAPKPSKN
jgi:O-antigen/teichoic acid export membrane protein